MTVEVIGAIVAGVFSRTVALLAFGGDKRSINFEP
jgi:hypothetical protein